MTPPGATADDLAIGIDIGGTKVAGGLVDKDGQVRGRARAHTPERSQSPQVVEDTIVGVIDELRAMATAPVSTVGIGAAGFVAADRATIVFAPHLSWRHEPLRDALAITPIDRLLVETDAPQGMVAVVRERIARLEEVLAGDPRLLVLLTHVRDPGNAGTVIRGADAAGADAVLVSSASVDVTSPKVVRSTAGSLFHLPVVTGLDVPETIARLRQAGVAVLAADGAGERLLPEVDLSGRHAWVMGNEAWGLDASVRELCDDVVRVPIHGRAESLNLAMAATVCLYASAGAQRAHAH